MSEETDKAHKANNALLVVLVTLCIASAAWLVQRQAAFQAMQERHRAVIQELRAKALE